MVIDKAVHYLLGPGTAVEDIPDNVKFGDSDALNEFRQGDDQLIAFSYLNNSLQ